MVENSSAGLVMLADEVTVTVIRERHHAYGLAAYPVAHGRTRRVAVELDWCQLRTGRHSGEHVIEVRLDGRPVGRLPYLLSRRYAPVMARVAASGDRTGCTAVIRGDADGPGITLRLPGVAEHAAENTGEDAAPPRPAERRTVSRRRLRWVAAAAAAGIVLLGVLVATMGAGGGHAPGTAAAGGSAPASAPDVVRPPASAPATIATTSAASTPAVVAGPATTTNPPPSAPAGPDCDPNYAGCVPVASDVDCVTGRGSGNGPAFLDAAVRVLGTDVYKLDRDGNGVACG